MSHLLKISPEDAHYILDELEKEGIIEEYNPKISQGYYVLINKN